MSRTTRFRGRTVLIAGLAPAVVMMMAFLAGCSREQPTVRQQASSQTQADAVAIEQKTCPVMEGNPIDKTIFVEYKGKKVYFCCKACPEKFLAEPEKYVSKLPQFKN